MARTRAVSVGKFSRIQEDMASMETLLASGIGLTGAAAGRCAVLTDMPLKTMIRVIRIRNISDFRLVKIKIGIYQ
jgi:hypothetical protein